MWKHENTLVICFRYDVILTVLLPMQKQAAAVKKAKKEAGPDQAHRSFSQQGPCILLTAGMMPSHLVPRPSPKTISSICVNRWIKMPGA